MFRVPSFKQYYFVGPRICAFSITMPVSGAASLPPPPPPNMDPILLVSENASSLHTELGDYGLFFSVQCVLIF